MEEEKKEHDTKMKKMEHDMEQVFESKVKEKMQKLLDSESEVRLFPLNGILFDYITTNLFSVTKTT